MNVLRIRAIALGLLTDAFAKEDLGYNQATYHSHGRRDMTERHCGTQACIGGHAVAAYDPTAWNQYQGSGFVDMFEVGRKILGIDIVLAGELFNGAPSNNRLPRPAETAAVLFKLAETGEVDWTADPGTWNPSKEQVRALGL